MINYNNGKIYKIEPICEHEEHEIYIGCTTKENLCRRMATNRNNYFQWLQGRMGKTRGFELFEKYGVDNCKMVLTELANVNSRDELLSRESHFIKTLNCVNKQLSEQSKEERQEYLKTYNIINKDKISLRTKIYRENHQECIKQYRNDHKNKK